jgi:hypothetical protein
MFPQHRSIAPLGQGRTRRICTIEKTTLGTKALQRDAIAGPGLDFAEPALVWPARHVY